MKRTLLTAAALGVLVTGQVAAQDVVTISPDNRARVKEYVLQQRLPPPRLPERVVVGTTIPTGVELGTMPLEWGPAASRYRYIYTDGQVVLVEPQTRRVVQILDYD
jgi:hypothetical protein